MWTEAEMWAEVSAAEESSLGAYRGMVWEPDDALQRWEVDSGGV